MPDALFDLLMQTAPTAGPGYVTVRKSSGGLVACRSVLHKSIRCDDATLMVQSVISSPLTDLQGDEVDPAGWDLGYHSQVRTVLYDHGVDYKLPVGLAEDADGNYTVRRAGDRIVADTYFAKTKMGEDLYDLCKQDVLRGWSATFTPLEPGVPIGPFDKSIKRCPMRFSSQQLLEYSVTPNPINVEALTILAEKGRGGNGAFHPVIAKSLSAYARIDRPATVAVPPSALILTGTPNRVVKAMPTDMQDDAGNSTGSDAMPTPTAQHGYDMAQGLADLIAHVEAGLTQGEHKRGKKKLKKLLDDLRGCQDEAKAIGDMVMSDLDDEAAEDQMVDDAEPVEKSADGSGLIVIKKAKYEPKRWTTKDLAAATGLVIPTGTARKSRTERDAEKAENRKARILARLEKKLPLLTGA